MTPELKDAIFEYQEALEESIAASTGEDKAKVRRTKARNRLLKAKETLRAMEAEVSQALVTV